MERALDAGGGLPGALDAVAALRRRGITTPIVLFGYYNPIFVMGPDVFAARAAAAGVDAVLTVDLPIDELDELAIPLGLQQLAVIPLVAPASTPERIARLARFRAPFVYYISLTGVTGTQAAAPVDPARIGAIREASGSRSRSGLRGSGRPRTPPFAGVRTASSSARPGRRVAAGPAGRGPRARGEPRARARGRDAETVATGALTPRITFLYSATSHGQGRALQGLAP